MCLGDVANIHCIGDALNINAERVRRMFNEQKAEHLVRIQDVAQGFANYDLHGYQVNIGDIAQHKVELHNQLAKYISR